MRSWRWRLRGRLASFQGILGSGACARTPKTSERQRARVTSKNRTSWTTLASSAMPPSGPSILKAARHSPRAEQPLGQKLGSTDVHRAPMKPGSHRQLPCRQTPRPEQPPRQPSGMRTSAAFFSCCRASLPMIAQGVAAAWRLQRASDACADGMSTGAGCPRLVHAGPNQPR